MKNEDVSDISAKMNDVMNIFHDMLPNAKIYFCIELRLTRYTSAETASHIRIYMSLDRECISNFEQPIENFKKLHKQVVEEYAKTIIVHDENNYNNFFIKFIDLLLIHGATFGNAFDKAFDKASIEEKYIRFMDEAKTHINKGKISENLEF